MIKILSPGEAKKIAAGEVIDRPAALVRELIDNAIDAGAQNIELSIEGGGINKIELIDDGSGMSKEDLALCVKTHATSKIQSLDDLSRFTTLGFRGEALAAAAAVARLEIVTSTGGREAWLLDTSTLEQNITATRRTHGTSVRSFGLFDSTPARKRFLKREASEAALCRQIFTEKALAFPGISFRFIQDNILKLQLLPCTSDKILALQKRFGELVLDQNERAFLHTVETSGKGFNITIVFGGPELYRKDRRQQYIFANKRRIQDFGLMQALEYGLDGFFPNGSHPLGAVFVEVDPALADFNIHPAKREVRFTDAGTIHHHVTTALRSYLGSKVYSHSAEIQNHQTFSFDSRNNSVNTESDFSHSLAMKALLDRRDEFVPLPTGFAAEQEIRYILGDHIQNANHETAQQNLRLVGRVFSLFILAEKDDKLYIFDQHAVHERILFDHYLSTPAEIQKLLVPIPFTTASEEDDLFLQTRKEELSAFGIVLKNEGSGAWFIEALPSALKIDDPVKEILNLRNSGKGLAESCAAVLACRAAVKDGDFLDDEAALTLAKAALALIDEKGTLPRCPHGRPLWTELSREALFKAVRR